MTAKEALERAQVLVTNAVGPENSYILAKRVALGLIDTQIEALEWAHDEIKYLRAPKSVDQEITRLRAEREKL